MRAMIDNVTPATSCKTLQPSSTWSVATSVVRRRLRVMLTATTLEERARQRPSRTAPASGSLRSRAAAPPAPPQLSDIQLDTDFEQKQHDAQVGEDLELMAVGDIAGREGRNQQPG